MPTRHGHARDGATSPTYKTWEGIIQRCTNTNQPNYPDYGGRGVGVCERWRDFANFLADMGARPAGKEIERIDNDAGYHPDNCRWASRADQNRNRRNNRMVEYGGETLCLADWSARTGIRFGALRYRLESGWTAERAFTTPILQPHEQAQVVSDALTGRSLPPRHRKRVGQGLRRAYANGSRETRQLTYHGETLHLAEWSRRTGIKLHTLMYRFRKGWSPERIIETPPRPLTRRVGCTSQKSAK